MRVWECQLTAHPRRLQNPPSLIGMPAALPVPGWVGQKRKGKELEQKESGGEEGPGMVDGVVQLDRFGEMELIGHGDRR